MFRLRRRDQDSEMLLVNLGAQSNHAPVRNSYATFKLPRHGSQKGCGQISLVLYPPKVHFINEKFPLQFTHDDFSNILEANSPTNVLV